MPPANLTPQFEGALSRLELGARRAIAIAARLEMTKVLRRDPSLSAHGLDVALIGSYGRHVSIWPGKDVDLFGKLTHDSTDSIEPTTAFDLFWTPLAAAFGDRATPQARSIKVDYRPNQGPARQFVVEAAASLGTPAPGQADGFEFSVDVVPAVQWGGDWGIPKHDQLQWTAASPEDRWTRTNPERLTDLTQELNKRVSINGQGAYVPTVKVVRQVRRHHLGKARPGGFFFELIVFEAFSLGKVQGDTWAEVVASTLRYVADRLSTVAISPVCDPALATPFAPTPDPSDIGRAHQTFTSLALEAERAVVDELCPAAAAWRRILGENTKPDGVSTPIFDLPSGCRADGSIAPVYGTPNRDRTRGSDEAHGFGRH